MSAPALPLGDLAARINAAHDAATGTARTAIEHAIECGRLLIEAKAAVAHGEWLPWLKANTAVSQRQSQRYMKLAAGWAEIETKNDATSHLTIDGALRLLASPQKNKPEAPPPPRHPFRDKTPEQRAEWGRLSPTDVDAWTLYLHADRRPSAEIAEFLGIPESRVNGIIAPNMNPSWRWDTDEQSRFHDLTAIALPTILEMRLQASRFHGALHALELCFQERRDDLAVLFRFMIHDAAARFRVAEARLPELVADMPRPFIAALFSAAGVLCSVARGADAAEEGLLVPMWALVGAMMIAGPEPWGDAFAGKYVGDLTATEHKKGADTVLKASEVFWHREGLLNALREGARL